LGEAGARAHARAGCARRRASTRHPPAPPCSSSPRHSFVTFDSDAAAERALASGPEHELAGKRVEVKAATPRGSGPVGVAAPPGGGGGPAATAAAAAVSAALAAASRPPAPPYPGSPPPRAGLHPATAAAVAAMAAMHMGGPAAYGGVGYGAPYPPPGAPGHHHAPPPPPGYGHAALD